MTRIYDFLIRSDENETDLTQVAPKGQHKYHEKQACWWNRIKYLILSSGKRHDGNDNTE